MSNNYNYCHDVDYRHRYDTATYHAYYQFMDMREFTTAYAKIEEGKFQIITDYTEWEDVKTVIYQYPIAESDSESEDHCECNHCECKTHNNFDGEKTYTLSRLNLRKQVTTMSLDTTQDFCEKISEGNVLNFEEINKLYTIDGFQVRRWKEGHPYYIKYKDKGTQWDSELATMTI